MLCMCFMRLNLILICFNVFNIGALSPSKVSSPTLTGCSGVCRSSKTTWSFNLVILKSHFVKKSTIASFVCSASLSIKETG